MRVSKKSQRRESDGSYVKSEGRATRLLAKELFWKVAGRDACDSIKPTPVVVWALEMNAKGEGRISLVTKHNHNSGKPQAQQGDLIGITGRLS